MEYYPTIKGNEVLVHATTWMNFEDIAEFKKPDKKNLLVHLSEISRLVKFIVTRSRLVVARG